MAAGQLVLTEDRLAARRWLQLALGVVCMTMIANLQYGWTLFVNPMQKAFGWDRSAIQVAFTIFIVTETWLVPLRAPDAEFIRKQPFAWRAPGIIIEIGFVEMLREAAAISSTAMVRSSSCFERWRKGEAWRSRVNPDGPIDPEAIKIHRIRPADLKSAPRFPTILPKMKDFVGESPIVAHAYKNERAFLDYEFARAKVIQWGESAYPEERYICTQVLFAQLFPGASKSLTSMCDRLVLDSSERDDRHGALLGRRHDCRCAYTAGAPTQAWRDCCAEIISLDLTGVTAASISVIQPMRPCAAPTER